MENVIPSFMIKRLTELSAVSLFTMVFLYVINMLIPKLFYSRLYKALMIIVITAFMVISIIVEMCKLYDAYTYEGDLEFRILYIASTIALSTFFYYMILKK